MAQYDLTPTLGGYLDRHMMIPLLEFLLKTDLYDEKQILQAKLNLLEKTNMVDLSADIVMKLQPESTPEREATLQRLARRREEILKRLKELEVAAEPLVKDVLANEELVRQLKAEKQFTMAHLSEKHGVSAAHVEATYELARFQYECGLYAAAAELLAAYRALGTNPERLFQALWGKLAAEILGQRWDEALEDLQRLREALEARAAAPSPGASGGGGGGGGSGGLQQLLQRAWLLHWSLFVYFGHANGRALLVDALLGQERYVSALQATCPHLLRYVAAAVITSRKRRQTLKELVRLIQQEAYTYRDPVVEFVECLYVNFDFEAAQERLQECSRLLRQDPFLASLAAEFLENARLFIFETYCRIHQAIDVGMLAQRLGLDRQAAEKWIVNLIRNARLDAKIDSARGHVLMGQLYPSIYQQVIEKTKGLAFRSYLLANNIDSLQH